MFGWLKQAVPGAALALGVAMAPQAAQAQFFGGWGYQTFRSGIDAQDVADIVADEGMRLIARPRRNGHVFVADARDGRGVQRRLIIDAAYGDILKSYTLRAGTLPYLEDARPVPPALIPQQRRVARAAPQSEPLVIPGIGREDSAPAVKRIAPPKPKVARRTPVEAKPSKSPVIVKELAPPVVKAPVASATPAVATAPAPLGDGEAKKPVLPPATPDVPVAPLD